MTVTSRNATVRDFVIFQVKLALDGMKDLVAFNLSIVALILDFISGRGRRPRLFYSVVRGSRRFDKWLNLHSVVDEIDRLAEEDRFIGEGEGFGEGEDEGSLALEIERLVKKSALGREEALRRLRAGADELRGKPGPKGPGDSTAN